MNPPSHVDASAFRCTLPVVSAVLHDLTPFSGQPGVLATFRACGTPISGCTDASSLRRLSHNPESGRTEPSLFRRFSRCS